VTTIDSSKRSEIVGALKILLTKFHQTNEANPNGFECVSWRGQLGGFRHGMRLTLGDRLAGDILDEVRDQTRLQFPHIGPVQDNGDILGFDSEAGMNL
jgi:hypothetical protein